MKVFQLSFQEKEEYEYEDPQSNEVFESLEAAKFGAETTAYLEFEEIIGAEDWEEVNPSQWVVTGNKNLVADYWIWGTEITTDQQAHEAVDKARSIHSMLSG